MAVRPREPDTDRPGRPRSHAHARYGHVSWRVWPSGWVARHHLRRRIGMRTRSLGFDASDHPSVSAVVVLGIPQNQPPLGVISCCCRVSVSK